MLVFSMKMVHRYIDPQSYCPGCSIIHGCLVIRFGHYCPTNSVAILTTGETTKSIQSALGFSTKGVSVDRKTFKERFDYWKSYLAKQ